MQNGKGAPLDVDLDPRYTVDNTDSPARHALNEEGENAHGCPTDPRFAADLLFFRTQTIVLCTRVHVDAPLYGKQRTHILLWHNSRCRELGATPAFQRV